MRRLLPFLFLLPACGEEGDLKYRVEELRVLGIRAEPAETQPGGTIQLDALVADPLGEGRPVAWVWAVCTPDPFVGESSCAEEGRTVPLVVGTAATFVVPENALEGLEPEAQERGIDLFIVLSVHADAPDEGEIAFKRVRVSTDSIPNENPSLESLTFDSTPVSGAEVKMTAIATSASAQSFEGPNGPRTEDLRFSWFTSAGDLEHAATFGNPLDTTNKWKAETPAKLWVVVRDGRGGVTWTTIDVSP